MLVGAGPGAADLLTVRALRAIEGAQALLYDALVGDEIIGLAPSACLRVQVGKRAGRASLRQETINRLMLRLARRGLDVVRLKGGDPSIFGRSGEEAEFLRGHGIEVEIVAGVTAASAAAAQFGFPLTHRGEARRLVMATARTGENQADDGDWACLADPQTTAAFYMGRDSARQVAARLIAKGRKPSTPAIAVENASRPDARLISARLDQLGEVVESAGFSGPVLLVVGETTARVCGAAQTGSDASQASMGEAYAAG
jgi:uroporphyrin-III C-methyltransferase